MSDDLRFMRLALALGRRGLGNSAPNPAVGAVIVKDGVILGRGWTAPGGRPHAETEAIRRAGSAARGATMYVTLEPCSHHGVTAPCADAIVAAGIGRVVSALEDPNPAVAGRGHARLRQHGVAVEVGLCAGEARRAHAGHIRRVRDRRPHVILKLAISDDGKVGLAGRRPVAITGEEARARVHALRAMSDAIAIGSGTALADDPLLTVRLPGMRSPVRIVFDTALSLQPDSRLAAGAREVPVWVLAGPDAPAAAERHLADRGALVLRVPPGPAGIDLRAAMRMLADRGLTRLLVEGGPRLAASFLRADLVDEAIVFRSPARIGTDGIDALDGLELAALTESPKFRVVARDSLGVDTVTFFERS